MDEAVYTVVISNTAKLRDIQAAASLELNCGCSVCALRLLVHLYPSRSGSAGRSLASGINMQEVCTSGKVDEITM